MKKNVSMFARLLPVVLVIAISTTACNRRPRWGTVMPGRNPNVSDTGPVGTGGNRSGANPGDLNISPIRPGGDGTGVNPNPIAVIPTDGIPSDPTGAGPDEWDKMNRDAEKFISQTVYFDFDKYNIKPAEVDKIRTVAVHLKANATHKVEVDGHCDERGTEEYNRSLGEKRAQSIREFLAREGVGPERVRTVSFGEDKPAVVGHDEGAWAKNRRGEFILLTPR